MRLKNHAWISALSNGSNPNLNPSSSTSLLTSLTSIELQQPHSTDLHQSLHLVWLDTNVVRGFIKRLDHREWQNALVESEHFDSDSMSYPTESLFPVMIVIKRICKLFFNVPGMFLKEKEFYWPRFFFVSFNNS